MRVFTLFSAQFNVTVKIFSQKIKSELCDTCHDVAVLITQVSPLFLVLHFIHFLSLKPF